MADGNGENVQGLPKELLDSIRKEAFSEAGKWIAGMVAILALAAVGGWWLYLKPKLIETLNGVPSGAVVSFDLRDK